MANPIDELEAMLARYQAAMTAALERAAPAVREQARIQADLFRSAAVDLVRLTREQSVANEAALDDLRQRLDALRAPRRRASPVAPDDPRSDALDAELEARLSADDFARFAHREYPIPPTA